MASINKVILIGNLGNDPEVRHFENGGSVARFSLATSESYIKKDTDEKITQTEWHTVVTRGGLASKVVEPYLKKGNSVYVEGKLKTRSWEDKNGETRYTTEVFCDKLELLGRKSDSQKSTDSAKTTEKQKSSEEAGDNLPF